MHRAAICQMLERQGENNYGNKALWQIIPAFNSLQKPVNREKGVMKMILLK